MAQKRILIASDATDVHSAAVAFALRRKGHDCEILYTPDFPTLLTLSLHVDPEDRAHQLLLRGPDVLRDDRSEGFDVIWRRRPAGVVLPEDMHAGEAMLSGLFAFLARRPDTFWVNSLASDGTALYKPFQLRSAVQAGLLVPETLFSNDPAQIRAFLRRHGGIVAYKLMRPASWTAEEDGQTHVYGAYTTALSEEQLPEDEEMIQLCPGIFQPLLRKSFEVRVCCLGDLLVAARINSQEDERASTDWRAGQFHVDMVPYELPPDVAASCRRLLADLGLIFASLDIVVDPQGRHLFLEVNPQGQFLFLETRTGVPLLDMFAEFLVAGTRKFAWSEDHEVVRFREFEEVWKQTWAVDAARHVRISGHRKAPDVP
jgi:glutathione synthase/RimK-type ligase-like ATP-grasp enzyme